VVFRAQFGSWPENAAVAVSEDGRGKVAGKRCGFFFIFMVLQECNKMSRSPVTRWSITFVFCVHNYCVSVAFHLSIHLLVLKLLELFVVKPALLKRQGVNVKGLVKAAPAKDEPELYIDCTGNLQV